MNEILSNQTADDVLEDFGDKRYAFFCVGCKMHHLINTDETVKPRWVWNGSMTQPTFSPSIHIKYETRKKQPVFGLPDDAPIVMVQNTCHSFVNDGIIDYLSDCTHEYSGKKVKLPKVSEWPY